MIDHFRPRSTHAVSIAMKTETCVFKMNVRLNQQERDQIWAAENEMQNKDQDKDQDKYLYSKEIWKLHKNEWGDWTQLMVQKTELYIQF